LEEKIKNISGVEKVKASHRESLIEAYYEDRIPDSEEIREIIKDAGYEVGADDGLGWFSRDINDYVYLLQGAIILIVLYLVSNFLGIFDFTFNPENFSLMAIFVMGLVASVSTCMALVGGLVLSISSLYSKSHPEMSASQKFIPHLYFNLGRVLGFGFLGGMLAAGGSILQLSGNLLGLTIMIIGLAMIILGFKLIKIFPFLERMSVVLPKNIAKFLGTAREQKKYSHRSAFLSGVITFFLPCGFTQAVQLYAVSSGSFTAGALVMSVFAMGTMPGLLGIGGLSSVLKGAKSKLFFATAGLAVILFGWSNLVSGSHLFFQENIIKDADNGVTEDGVTAVQEIRMTQGSSGYTPREFVIERGKKVRWIINSTNQFSCASSISVPQYGIKRNLKLGENIIEFTPTATGDISFSCTMGMYRGKFVVVESK
jgi:sulfite exporter TauE/SafE